MRKSSWIVIGLAALALAVACSTTEDEDTGPRDGGSAGGAYTPTPNGVGMGELAACEAILDAIDENVERLGCVYTRSECPGYIRQSGAPECSQYDQGTVEGCADFYATFTKCSEFQDRPCHINNILDSAPSGCEEDDAGTDAEVDAEGDAEVDAKVDADIDAKVDAEIDAAEVDAEIDAELDAEADAAAE
jgi:hypothetical protein